MRSKKSLVSLASLVVLAIIITISLRTPYAEDLERIQTHYTYEDSIKGIGDNQILLLADESDELKTHPIQEGTEMSWTFQIDESGWYEMNVGYLPDRNEVQDLVLDVYIDNKNMADDSGLISLSRVWKDTGGFRKTAAGNEMRPKQVQVEHFIEGPFYDQYGRSVGLQLEKGEHTLTLKGKESKFDLNYVLLQQEAITDYETYLSEHSGDTNTVDPLYLQLTQAEVPYLKSSTKLYATADRSSSYTQPYHPTEMRMNTIGGSNWSKQGEWIEWQFDVPEDGFYQIGLRYRQNSSKGVTSSRKVEIDGKVLFEELEEVKFDYGIDWNNMYLGEEEPYQIYLTEGTHTLKMEVVLGEVFDEVVKMQETINKLNEIYRQIIMITGNQPDIYRDYNLETAIPHLIDDMKDIVEMLEGYEAFLATQYQDSSASSRVVTQLRRQIESFIESPYTIQKRLSNFKTNISAFTEWTLSIKDQPLEIDSLYITGRDVVLPASEPNMFGKLGHEIRSFLGSFTQDYNDITSEGGKNETITVWMGKGRDQANVMKRLIDEYFTPATGINVNISLVEGALVKAAVAGEGPDVNLFTSRSDAMNLAFRGALEPLDTNEGFQALKEQYMDNAFVPYTYRENIYGIPEEQSFYMMFCRTDILNELNVEVPNTWEDLLKIMPILQYSNLQIGLPYANGYAVMASGVGTANLFPTLLAQKDIHLFNEDATKTQLDTAEAYELFEMWTNFYSLYDYPLYKDDFNRFRTGEMPIVISGYGLYNTLTELAPEIAGQWTMLPVPGTPNEKTGEIDRSTCASGSSSIILKDTSNKEASWEFVKWWNSEETQALYSQEIEAELGILGRWTPANIDGFIQTNWSSADKEILLNQWKEVIEIPEIPGGYYVARNIDNAFREVLYEGENPRESLYYWNQSINEEIVRKKQQLEKR